MKKKWWQNLGNIAGVLIFVGFVALNNDFKSIRNISGIVLIIIGVITFATYMFMKQGERAEEN